MSRINKTRSFLYKFNRILGDYEAIRKGKAGKRLARRITGRAVGKGLGRLFK